MVGDRKNKPHFQVGRQVPPSPEYVREYYSRSKSTLSGELLLDNAEPSAFFARFAAARSRPPPSVSNDFDEHMFSEGYAKPDR